MIFDTRCSGVHNVAMGNAPEIGDALLTSSQVSLAIFMQFLSFVSLPFHDK